LENSYVTSFTITYHSGALQTSDSFFTYRTYITRNGLIRLTFERDMIKQHGYFQDGRVHLPYAESYEYRVDRSTIEAEIFRRFDLLQLRSFSHDNPGCDMGSWDMVIRTKGQTVKLSGYEAPEPFGRELVDAIRGLLNYQVEPVVF
jgi:hypothetical protein